MTDLEGKSVLDRIADLSSAEEIFTYLILPYEEGVLSVNRLHIMKRMGQYLKARDFTGMDDNQVFLEIRATLKQAYQDFLDSTPLKEKVFKVFKDEAEKHARRFVGLDSLKLTTH